MISDTTLTNLSNGLGVSAMLLIVVYHFIAVNGKRMEAQGGKTVADLVSSIVEQKDYTDFDRLYRNYSWDPILPRKLARAEAACRKQGLEQSRGLREPERKDIRM
jgi:hypothetical protein